MSYRSPELKAGPSMQRRSRPLDAACTDPPASPQLQSPRAEASLDPVTLLSASSEASKLSPLLSASSEASKLSFLLSASS